VSQQQQRNCEVNNATCHNQSPVRVLTPTQQTKSLCALSITFLNTQ